MGRNIINGSISYQQDSFKDEANRHWAIRKRIATIRIILAVGVREGLFHQMEVKIGSLHGEQKEVIYLSAPDSVAASPGMACKWRKALYGDLELLFKSSLARSRSWALFGRRGITAYTWSTRTETYIILCVDDHLIAARTLWS